MPSADQPEQGCQGWSRMRQRPLLGTFVEIGVAGDDADADRAIDDAFAAIEAVHRLMSFHEPDSDVGRLNRAGGEAVRLHPLTLRVLRLARAMTVASGGLFNCTVGGELVARGALPDPGVNAPLPAGSADDIMLDGETARLERPILVTLDGIAKGFAVDVAVGRLRHSGMRAGIVNAGGDMRVFGDVIAPVYQCDAEGRLCPLGGLRNGAIASSRSGLPWDDRFPAMIVGDEAHPPAKGVWSVLARTAWRADALTKVAALASDPLRAALIEELRGRLVEEQK